MASKDGREWNEAPPELRAKAMGVFAEKQRLEQERVARFGQIRPQISTVWQGQRMVAVRNRFNRSDKWKFFSDFLRDYVPEGQERLPTMVNIIPPRAHNFRNASLGRNPCQTGHLG
jgi:hypothetical protein